MFDRLAWMSFSDSGEVFEHFNLGCDAGALYLVANQHFRGNQLCLFPFVGFFRKHIACSQADK